MIWSTDMWTEASRFYDHRVLVRVDSCGAPVRRHWSALAATLWYPQWLESRVWSWSSYSSLEVFYCLFALSDVYRSHWLGHHPVLVCSICSPHLSPLGWFPFAFSSIPFLIVTPWLFSMFSPHLHTSLISWQPRFELLSFFTQDMSIFFLAF